MIVIIHLTSEWNTKRKKKNEKYQELKQELKQIWKSHRETMASIIVIGALGANVM